MSKENYPKENYDKTLLLLQIELVKMQKQIISKGDRVLVIFEGRDAAGKDGSIKRIVEHLSPRETKVVALGKPSEQEVGEWYFQRYVSELPGKGQLTLFNRSWYNRAGVERVMNFCTKDEYEQFMNTVNRFESILVDSGLTIIKYYLDISKQEQAFRLNDRKTDPLKQWKISPIDMVAQKKWAAYSKARNDMLMRTNHDDAHWTVIRANNKKLAHINIIRDLLSHFDYPQKNKKILNIDKSVVLYWPSNSKKIFTLEP
jgi:polyphosphate kinase 2